MLLCLPWAQAICAKLKDQYEEASYRLRKHFTTSIKVSIPLTFSNHDANLILDVLYRDAEGEMTPAAETILCSGPSLGLDDDCCLRFPIGSGPPVSLFAHTLRVLFIMS